MFVPNKRLELLRISALVFESRVSAIPPTRHLCTLRDSNPLPAKQPPFLTTRGVEPLGDPSVIAHARTFVPLERLELPTPRFVAVRSNPLSYRGIN